ncbi:fatty acid desaturase family protein [Sandaracinus amylolyticus]|nr:fatty acid desaturase [Sandaracinus amylolyticus]
MEPSQTAPSERPLAASQRVAPDAWPPGRRSAKELLAAAKEFGKEDRARSWFHVVETFGVLAALSATTIAAPWLVVRVIAAVVMGLTIVRAFILYHDYMHNSLLRGSKVAKWIMYGFGVYVLTPPNVWRQTHNYHHANTAKIVGSHVGSYLMVTTEMWKQMTPTQRLVYKAYRHPLTIFFAYFTVFFYGMCVSSFLRNPKKNWDSALAVVLHVAAWIALIALAGFEVFFVAYFLPLFVATMSGAYLFYAQHDFPEMHVQPRETWEYTRAALESSSYMKTGPVMAWFTGNIGYHHVHHLNPGIPFYRLPEAMASIPELQSPKGTTSLHPRDIVACFRAKLWDAEQSRMVGYPEGT